MLLGAHVSIAGGLHRAFAVGRALACTVIQIFTKNATRWQVKPLALREIEEFRAAWQASGIRLVVAHTSYLINLGTPEVELLKKSREALWAEVERCEQLGIPSLVLHPGAHVGSGEKDGLTRIAESLNDIHARTPEFSTRILLETTAGQGTNLGYRFEQLAQIFERLDTPQRVGVCFDTCHTFAAGYDLRTADEYQQTFTAFDRIVGLQLLHVIHLNDSQKGLGSRIDRHQNIGSGAIGLDGFRFIMNDPRLANVPKIIETPKGKDPLADDRANLQILRELVQYA